MNFICAAYLKLTTLSGVI